MLIELFKPLITRSFSYIFLILAIIALIQFGNDSGKLFLYFLIPFYVISLCLEIVMPKVKTPLEKNELLTDIISNGVVMTVVNSIQNMGLAVAFAWSSSSFLIHFEILPASFGLSNAHFITQVITGLFILDFLFYVTHRISHESSFFWRFHSVHHCAHKVSFMNAYRVHPFDAMFRRYIPLFFVTLTGISPEAMTAIAIIGTVLATVTHLNIDLKHGWLNYFIATNELHRWHHSTVYEEAKNFAIFTVWDHMFGTYYWPKSRDLPEKTGLSHEKGFPIHNYWQQLLIPFNWHDYERSIQQDENVDRNTKSNNSQITTN